MEPVKMFSNFGLVWGAYALFIVLTIYIFYKLIEVLPKAIDKHFEELRATREEYSKNLENITDKFSSNLDNMNSINKNFFAKIEQQTNKNYNKLEEIHTDIKTLKTK